jgi:hypothetical protein
MRPRQLLTVRKGRTEASAHAEEEMTLGRSQTQTVIICKVVVNTFLSTTRFFFHKIVYDRRGSIISDKLYSTKHVQRSDELSGTLPSATATSNASLLSPLIQSTAR